MTEYPPTWATPSLTEFRPRCLCLDIETTVDDPVRVLKIGAWRADTDASLSLQGELTAQALHDGLAQLTTDAACLLGHNLTEHDLPILKNLYPTLSLHALPSVGTLWLSPLAFPQNPYHRLVKDYQLIRDSRNDPLKDAQLSFRLFHDQVEAFRRLHDERPGQLACYHFLLGDLAQGYYDRLFMSLRGQLKPNHEQTRDIFRNLIQDRVCATHLDGLLPSDWPRPDERLPLLTYWPGCR